MEQTASSFAPVSQPVGAACPWCNGPLPDAAAPRCPSCDAALQPAEGAETVVPGLTELTAEAAAARDRANGTAGAVQSTAVPPPAAVPPSYAAFPARSAFATPATFATAPTFPAPAPTVAPPPAPESVVVQQELFAAEPVTFAAEPLPFAAPEPPRAAPTPAVPAPFDLATAPFDLATAPFELATAPFDPAAPAPQAVVHVDLTADELSAEAVRSLAARETFEDVSDESFAPPSDEVQRVMRELKRAAAEAARYRVPTRDAAGSDRTA